MITMLNSITYFGCVIEAWCVFCEVGILNLLVRTMVDTGSFAVLHMDCIYIITCLDLDFYCTGLRCHSVNILKSRSTNKRKHTKEGNVGINILFRLSWRFVYALH